jgi:purine-binding chemotaxis protein CheW
MLESDHLRIVFRIAGIGFVMPVSDLLSIREAGDDPVDCSMVNPDSLQLGELTFREVSTPIRDIAGLFGLSWEGECDASRLLVFAGSDLPWALAVDHVEGVLAVEQLMFKDVGSYLFDQASQPYHQVALWQAEPLVCCETGQLDAAWMEA